MAEENNGKNGKVGLVDRVKDDIQAMKVDIPGQGEGTDRGAERSHQDSGLHFHLPPQA